MPPADAYADFVRYLAAKTTVDDRALNAHVWATLARALPAGKPAVLEVGAGTGTMIDRIRARGLLANADYTAVDADPANIAALGQRLTRRGYAPGADGAWHDGGWRVRAEAADVFDFIGRTPTRYDLLIAHAFLDLLHLPTAVPRLLAALRPGGLFYFSITFDGVTAFEPLVDPALDALIEARYHQTMDDRVDAAGAPSGDRHAGRRLLSELRAHGATLLAAGSSDWVVLPDAPGSYPADEAYFLHFIIATVQRALADDAAVEPAALAHWTARRHAQIAAGELIYIAHQLDVVGRVPSI